MKFLGIVLVVICLTSNVKTENMEEVSVLD